METVKEWRHVSAADGALDPVTGVPTRHVLLERLRDWTGRAPVTVVHIDITDFRRINDLFGWDAGDELLGACAGRLARFLAPGGLLVRLSSAEFAACVWDTAATDIEHLVRGLEAAAAGPYRVGRREVHLRITCGAFVGRPQDHDPATFLRSALAAQYKAATTHARWALVTGDDSDARQRLLVQGELENALADGRVRAHFQPIVAPNDHRLLGFEALVRWHDDALGWLRPDIVVGIAEQSGYIDALFECMVGWAGEFAAMRRHARESFVPISINVSPSQLSGTALGGERVLALLGDAGLRPADIYLEVTETSLLGDLQQARRTLADLAAAGVNTVLDDFGVGYSSLTHLLHLPITCVKIDRAFIGRLSVDSTAQALTRAVIAMARSLGIGVVAEGVETQGQFDWLRRADVDAVQGYLIARPMAAGNAVGFR